MTEKMQGASDALDKAREAVLEAVSGGYHALEYFYRLPDPPGRRAGEYRLDLDHIIKTVDAWDEATKAFFKALQE